MIRCEKFARHTLTHTRGEWENMPNEGTHSHSHELCLLYWHRYRSHRLTRTKEKKRPNDQTTAETNVSRIRQNHNNRFDYNTLVCRCLDMAARPENNENCCQPPYILCEDFLDGMCLFVFAVFSITKREKRRKWVDAPIAELDTTSTPSHTHTQSRLNLLRRRRRRRWRRSMQILVACVPVDWSQAKNFFFFFANSRRSNNKQIKLAFYARAMCVCVCVKMEKYVFSLGNEAMISNRRRQNQSIHKCLLHRRRWLRRQR